MKQDEVLGNISTYHRTHCHTIRNSYSLTKYESWKGAVAEGMKPCGVCYPFFSQIVEIVIGDLSTSTYHEPDCHILRNVERYQLTKFQSWDDAVVKGMKPCGVCTPRFFTLKIEEVIGGIITYHRPHCPCLKYIQPVHTERYQSWEEAEAQYRKPCVLCRPSLILKKEPTPTIAVPTTEPTQPISGEARESTLDTVDSTKEPTHLIIGPDQTVDVTQLTDWRRRVIWLVRKLDKGYEHSTGESIAGKISRLTKNNVIPRYVAAFMRTVTEMRNIAEYESKTLSPSESDAVRAAWKVIEEWAQGQQIEP
ncbi:MAG: hypothetical protein WCJ37_03435 [Syntrophus sp. (in: bacteria)]